MTTSGARLRTRIEEEYDVDGAAAGAVIDAIVATADELELLEKSIREDGVLLEGARGQRVANPALAAITRHRALLSKLLSEAFPGEQESVSEQAARAARARWRKK